MMRHTMMLALAGGLMLAGCHQAPKTDAQGFVIDPGFEQKLQQQLLDAKPGDVVAIPAGKYALTRSLSVTANGVTIKRSEEHTSELQSLMRISYAVFCLKKKNA